MASTPSSVARSDTRRDSFNAAYANLESSIRNFSKEKLMYEQKIDTLKTELHNQKERFDDLNIELQTVLSENKRLQAVHDEDEVTRAAVEATIAAVERKQEIHSETLEGFSRVEQDIIERYEHHADFLHCMKFRQLQLLDWIAEVSERIEELEEELGLEQQKCYALTNQCNEAAIRIEQDNAKFVNEKATWLAEYQSVTSELQEKDNTISHLQNQLEETKTQMQQQSELFQDKERQMKTDFEEKRNILEESLKKTEAERNSLETLLNDLQIKSETAAKVATERQDALEKQIEELRISSEDVKTRLQNVSAEKNGVEEELAKTKTEIEELTESFSEKEKILASQLEETVALMEQQEETIANCAKEKKELMEKHAKEKEELMEKHAKDKEELMEKHAKDKEEVLEKHAKEKEEVLEKHAKEVGEKEAAVKKLQAESEAMTAEYTTCKTNLRALYQRYQSQKTAIAKLVEDTGAVGVRPSIILPSNKTSGSRSSVASTTPVMSPYTKVAPITPKVSTASVVPSNSIRSPRSILKRSNNDSVEKSVSFGETTIKNFTISSGSSDSDTSPNKSQTSGVEGFENSKRPKLTEDMADSERTGEDENSERAQSGDTDNEKEKEVTKEASVKPRRYIKQRIGQVRGQFV